MNSRGERVARGNAIDADTYYVRTAHRGALTPGYRMDNTGFRCASSQ